jgi:flagellar protein FlaG
MKLDSVQNPVATAPAVPQPQSHDLSANRELIQAVRAINPAELFGKESEMTFIMDRETRKPLVRIVDRNTKEVLLQIPAEWALEMARQSRTHK